jgi:hypothetical protein
MANRRNKQGQKEALHRWKVDRKAAARAALPLSDDWMQAMFDMLDVELLLQGCDKTRRLTKDWLVKHHLAVDAVLTWLDNNGGYCDCEVLNNAEEAWEEATDRNKPGSHQNQDR